ncbi:MAG: AI-2E family transporter [Alphaproteobacteria bacterium]|nr:AI-2E family transporter [Alphaproteobacteria bacterium]
MTEREASRPRKLAPAARGSTVPATLLAGLIIAALYFGRVILVPCALAVLLSFLLAPAVRWLRRWRVPRVSAVIATVLLAFIAILGFGVVIGEEIASLGQNLPEYQQNLNSKVRSLQGVLPGAGLFGRASTMFRELGKELSGSPSPGVAPAGAVSSTANPVPVVIREPETAPLQVVESVIGPLLEPLATSGLVIVFVVLILLKREDLRDRLLRLAGGSDIHRTTEAMNDAAQRVSRYLLMQLIINGCYGIPVGLGLTVIGIPNAALWGMMAVLLRFIPYFGVVIAAAFPLALAVAVDPGWSLLGWTVLLLVAIELVISNIVEPWVYGVSTGLSSVAVILAATFWTWLWGPVGLLLSTPLTVCLVVLGRHVPQLQFLDVLLGNEPALAPEESLYQRLLANDPEEATEQAEEFSREKSITAFFDEVAIPALAMAQADSDRDAMTVERRARVSAGFATMLENLAEDGLMEPDPGEPEAQPRRGPVVCVAGRNELDAAAAELLRHLLQSHGQPASVLPPETLSADNPNRVALREASIVCLSLLSTSSAARARYLVRRLRRRARGARLVVGFWGQSPTSLSIAELTAATAADAVVTSVSDAVAEIETSLRDGEAGAGQAMLSAEPGARLADQPA